ncbi:MAG TPA: pilus assembly protein TadG-related protein [Pirellulales bacterium]|jgi:Flp pilus assembly protein TadG|nr:pilus assembly protein TadG-related protein [Pirellulales bacterium]
MFARHRKSQPRGVVAVLMVVSLFALLGFLALSIDLGMLAMTRAQLQDVSDAASMAGCRALNGNTANNANNNYAAVAPTAAAVATANTVMGGNVQSGNVSVNIGRWVYNTSAQSFQGQFPGPSGTNWSMVQATVTSNISNQLAFSRLFNYTGGTVQVTSTAIHRPRDIAIVLDFSGSMRFSSLLGTDYETSTRSSNNPDGLIPVWGHYSDVSDAGLQATTFTLPYNAANITVTTSDGRPPVVQDFYIDANGTPAFTAASAAYASVPGGDPFLKVTKNTGSTYATCVADLLTITNPTTSTRDATFESTGYKAYSMLPAGTQGYTEGPGYWGKTFFLWPPDPTNDWRQKFFTYPGTTTPMTDNSRLWDNNGNWQAPGPNTYEINYTAILNWIQNTGPNPFPSTMRSGRIVYYTSMPTTIDTGSWPPSDLNQRFWKDYIDYCLGLIQLSSNNWEVINNGNTGEGGYGTDYAWGNTQITPQSSLKGSPAPYMDYGDNPLRPKLHFWFGPLSMVDCLGNYNVWYDLNPYCSRFAWWPGTCHESPTYECKLGISAALSDIQANHPNDFVSLMMFSVPQSSSTDTSGTRFNRVRVGLGQNYSNMQDSLWYPPATVGSASATVTPYDSNNLEVPRALGGTCYSMPLMQAYNQFSANSTLVGYNGSQPAGDAGGNGRKGAQKIIIFETDGAPNTTAGATVSNGGPYLSYYNILYNSANPGGSQYPTGINGYSDNSSAVTSQIYSICNQICALDSASPPGYSTTTKPVLIHCLGFGPFFAPGSSTAAANTATLNAMQIIGNVTDNMPAYKIIYGNQAQVVSSLQQAFNQILQSGVQVSLVQ